MILFVITTFLLTFGNLTYLPQIVSAENHNIGTIDDYTGLSIVKQEKAREIIHNLKAQLSQLGLSIEHSKVLTNLNDEQKAKAKEIFKQLREGKITRDEAYTKLEELGISIPNNHENLDEETKEKAASIVEDARSQLKQLGIKLPKRFERIIKETGQK